MAEAQQRIVAHLINVHSSHPGGRVVLVSHCDVIRAAVLHYIGISLDDYDAVEIAPAAVTGLELNGRGGKVLALNTMVPA